MARGSASRTTTNRSRKKKIEKSRQIQEIWRLSRRREKRMKPIRAGNREGNERVWQKKISHQIRRTSSRESGK